MAAVQRQPLSQQSINTPAKNFRMQDSKSVEVSSDFKRSVLANMEFEVEHKILQFASLHEALLTSFRNRQEIEISKIPLTLRNMTVRELGENWNGNLQGTFESIVREKLESKGKEDDDSVFNVKRKRNTDASSNSNNTTKSTNSTTQPPTPSISHKFHPALPKTPLVGSSSTTTGFRRPRRGESIAVSTNGSPLQLFDEEEHIPTEDGPGEGEEFDDAELELEDEEELLKKMKAQAGGATTGLGISAGTSAAFATKEPTKLNNRGRRASTIVLSRQRSTDSVKQASAAGSASTIHIPVFADGTTISFNPDFDSPSKLEEMDISDSAKKAAKKAIFKRFQELQNKWGSFDYST